MRVIEAKAKATQTKHWCVPIKEQVEQIRTKIRGTSPTITNVADPHNNAHGHRGTEWPVMVPLMESRQKLSRGGQKTQQMSPDRKKTITCDTRKNTPITLEIASIRSCLIRTHIADVTIRRCQHHKTCEHVVESLCAEARKQNDGKLQAHRRHGFPVLGLHSIIVLSPAFFI